MSNELILPPYLFPAKIELAMQDSIGLFQPSFGFGVSQRINFGATYWRAKISFEKLTTTERHELLAMLTGAGRFHAIYIPIYGEAKRGSGVFAELLTDTATYSGTFESGVDSWTKDASYTITVNGRVARCTRNAVGTAQNAIRTAVLTSAIATFPHAFRAMITPGKAVFDLLSLRMGSTAGGLEWGSLTIAAGDYGLFTLAAVTTTTSLSVTVRDGDTAGQAVNDYFNVPWLSAARCGLVAGASQVGSALNTDGWAVSTNGLLERGDFVNVVLPSGLHLARLTDSLNSSSTGTAYMQFEPPLPESPADNAGIIVTTPLLKCVIGEAPVVTTYPPGYLSDVEIQVVGVF